MSIDFERCGGLVPVIVQDARSQVVLMLGYMNREAYEKTRGEGIVTFFSRSKQRLWTKGESSGNKLSVESMQHDCDNDTILIKAIPSGPVCHTGDDTCFKEHNQPSYGFLSALEETVLARKSSEDESSYCVKLFKAGVGRIAQKVGEEAVETVVAAMQGDSEALCAESADLLFHLVVLLAERGVSLRAVVSELEARHQLHSAEAKG